MSHTSRAVIGWVTLSLLAACSGESDTGAGASAEPDAGGSLSPTVAPSANTSDSSDREAPSGATTDAVPLAPVTDTTDDDTNSPDESDGGTGVASDAGGPTLDVEPTGSSLPSDPTGSEVPMAVAFVVEPTFTGNGNPDAPQVGILSLETDVAVPVEVTVSGGDETWTLELPADTNFSKPIVGLKPATVYTLDVSVATGENTLTAGPLTWETPPLPDTFPQFTIGVSDPSKMEPGMTLFNARTNGGATTPAVIIDNQGVVRWYYFNPDNPAREDTSQLANGNILFNNSRCVMSEVDYLGTVTQSWHASEFPLDCNVMENSTPVPVVAFHHELTELPDGNFLVLSGEGRTVEGFPTSYENPDAPTETATITTGVIVEFTPAGEVLKHIVLADLLDPTRIGRGSFEATWPRSILPAGTDGNDWDHSNAVFYDEPSDSYYVSMRHQDAVAKINRTSETLTWILGNHANWKEPWTEKLLTPVGDLAWQYHQHDPQLTPLGLLLYDNGNGRAPAYEPTQDEYSRAVIYAIDESAMTVSQVWSYGAESGEASVYSSAMGGTEWQPTTGNVLLVHGQIAGNGPTYAQIVEVTADGERVFELTLGGNGGGAGGFGGGGASQIFRADRIPDIRN